MTHDHELLERALDDAELYLRLGLFTLADVRRALALG